MEKSNLIFITGGVRSGKSATAEQLAIDEMKASSGNLHYIACGVQTDNEMKKRVWHHQKRRKEANVHWITWEQPKNLAGLTGKFTKNDVLLVDCLTTLLTNEWFVNPGAEEEWEHPFFHEGIKQRILAGVDALCKEAGCVVLVSNELCYETFHTPLVFHYAKVLGALHQAMVQRATRVILVEHGCLLEKKAEMIRKERTVVHGGGRRNKQPCCME